MSFREGTLLSENIELSNQIGEKGTVHAIGQR